MKNYKNKKREKENLCLEEIMKSNKLITSQLQGLRLSYLKASIKEMMSTVSLLLFACSIYIYMLWVNV
jgi:hypothetical protein